MKYTKYTSCVWRYSNLSQLFCVCHGLDNAGFESRQVQDIFSPAERPDLFWSPHSLVFSAFWDPLLEVKRPGHEVGRSPAAIDIDILTLEDETTILSRNIGHLSPSNAVPHCRIHETWTAPVRTYKDSLTARIFDLLSKTASRTAGNPSLNKVFRYLHELYLHITMSGRTTVT